MFQQVGSEQEIAGFDVLEVVGYGARSTLYAVKDENDQVFVLKRVVKRDPQDQRFLDQALNEHHVASHLDHRSLRKSFRLIKHRRLIRTSEIIILMELVDGLTLEQTRLDSLGVTCHVTAQVADALSFMHQGGFVHADIKPNNILVTEQMNVKIIDFGQSCRIGTVKQRIQGTPDYIAPEQVRCGPIVPQTDIFNLGATLYWLLTRKHVPTLLPKGGNSSRTNLHSPTSVAAPSALNPAIPPALSSLVMNCVETDPSQRPSSMTEVKHRLELAIEQIGRLDHTPNPSAAEGIPAEAPASHLSHP